MSMTIMTALQMACVFLAYTVTVFALPRLAFHTRTRGMGMVDRFVFCMVVGNFWIMNAVLLLFTLKICNVYTLIASTYGVSLLAGYWRERVRVNAFFRRQAEAARWLLRGELKGMLYLRRGARAGRIAARAFLCRTARRLAPRLAEIALLLLCCGFNLWYFSYQTFTYLSFGTSDMVVHSYWINAMADGVIFVNGVYPYGFHALVYYLDVVFGMDTFYILRVFGPIQSMYIFLMIYALGRKLCRSRAAPLAALIAISVTSAFTGNTMMRYQWAIPQEHAMLYLYPAIYYLIAFLDARSAERPVKRERHALLGGALGRGMTGLERARALGAWRAERRRVRPESTFPLVLFGIAFAQTLIVHFYITMIAAVFCVAVGLSRLPGVLRPRVFLRLALCVLLSVLVALAPMVAAYVGGKPLENSLRWGVNVISSSEKASVSADAGAGEASGSAAADATPKGFRARFAYYFGSLYNYIAGKPWQSALVALAALMAVGTLIGLCVKRLRARARNWLALGLYLTFLLIMLMPHVFGVPKLMDDSRVVIFIAYAATFLFAYPVELFEGLLRAARPTRCAAGALACAALYLMLGTSYFTGLYKRQDLLRKLSSFYMLQYNANVTVLYDLIYRYPTQKWTLVSTVTETRQVFQHGWHYDLGDFILSQEDWTEKSTLYIPTQYVFIFLEKRVMDYAQTVDLNNADPSFTEVSETLAARKLDKRDRSSKLYGANRGAIMSKLMCWIEAFEKLYPNEFEVYYEDENTICYKIEQNEEYLYNYAIDYGHNRPTAKE